MKEYRLVALPPMEKLWASLLSDIPCFVDLTVVDADKPDSPQQTIKVSVVTLNNDREPDHLWIFRGYADCGEVGLCQVSGMFVYPAREKVVSMITIH